VSRESRPRLQSGPKSGRFRCRSRERCSRWWPKRLPQQAWSKGLQRRLHGRMRPGQVADREPPASGVCSENGCPHGVAELIALLHHVPQLVFHNASRASVVVPGVSRSIRPVPRNPHPLGGFFLIRSSMLLVMPSPDNRVAAAERLATTQRCRFRLILAGESQQLILILG
jgi:hypothetical protein